MLAKGAEAQQKALLDVSKFTDFCHDVVETGPSVMPLAHHTQETLFLATSPQSRLAMLFR
jgi:hypothetical protein